MQLRDRRQTGGIGGQPTNFEKNLLTDNLCQFLTGLPTIRKRTRTAACGQFNAFFKSDGFVFGILALTTDILVASPNSCSAGAIEFAIVINDLVTAQITISAYGHFVLCGKSI